MTMLEELAKQGQSYRDDVTMEIAVIPWDHPVTTINISPCVLLALVAREINKPDSTYPDGLKARDKMIASLRQMLDELDAKQVEEAVAETDNCVELDMPGQPVRRFAAAGAVS